VPTIERGIWTRHPIQTITAPRQATSAATIWLPMQRPRNNSTVTRRAKGSLRVGGLLSLPSDNPRFARKYKDLKPGKPLSPVLCLCGDLQTDAVLTTADAYHCVCASYLFDEVADIPYRLAELPRFEEPLATELSTHPHSARP
jgi:hypothetical protein